MIEQKSPPKKDREMTSRCGCRFLLHKGGGGVVPVFGVVFYKKHVQEARRERAIKTCRS